MASVHLLTCRLVVGLFFIASLRCCNKIQRNHPLQQCVSIAGEYNIRGPVLRREEEESWWYKRTAAGCNKAPTQTTLPRGGGTRHSLCIYQQHSDQFLCLCFIILFFTHMHDRTPCSHSTQYQMCLCGCWATISVLHMLGSEPETSCSPGTRTPEESTVGRS